MPSTTLHFAAAARALGEAARTEGWTMPGFRSPPRHRDADRSLRRGPDGSAMVSVRLRGRPWPAVLADMVEGVVVVNGLTGAESHRCRTRLWSVLETAHLIHPAVGPPGETGADAHVAPGPGASVTPIARVA
jgi:hypothetical protein